MLHRPDVREELLPILTDNMLGYFQHMPTDDKQQIENAFRSKTQRDAAEVFLSKITQLANDEWHRELITALANLGSIDLCQFLCEEFQKNYASEDIAISKGKSTHSTQTQITA